MRDWPRFALALDMRLSGATLDQIAVRLGVTRERARQIVAIAKQQLAFRVFKGVPTANAVVAEHRRQARLKEWGITYDDNLGEYHVKEVDDHYRPSSSMHHCKACNS